MTRKSVQTSITGRDGYIVNQALLYAIAHIQSLPPEKQEWSNMRDMCAIARTNFSIFTYSQVQSIEWHTGKELTFWPEHNDDLTEEERAARDDFGLELRRQKEAWAELDRQHTEEVARKQEAAA